MTLQFVSSQINLYNKESYELKRLLLFVKVDALINCIIICLTM